MPSQLSVAAVLIVRDEVAMLAGCLESLRGVVDEVHVHDTGSRDGTQDLARSLGAVVTQGAWDDDFADARNEALLHVRADWVLSLDADERAVGDTVSLRRLLARTSADALCLDIDNRHDQAPYTHLATRLFRPASVHWRGRVHERLEPRAGGTLREGLVGRDVLRLDHEGYAGAPERRAKALRNAELAQAALDQLTSDPAAAASEVAQTLLDLGRSKVGADQLQDAIDTFEALRELFPGTSQALQGTDAFVRLLLGAGMDRPALVLTAELRASGASNAYCDWLEAQALAQLGEIARASELLDGVGEVVDVSGRRYDPRQLAALKVLMNDLRAAH